MKISSLISILILSIIVHESSALDVKLFGTRKDIKFLNIEGDILRPLSYEFDDRDVNFISINMDSSDNDVRYKAIVESVGGMKNLPVVVIDENILMGQQISKKVIGNIIDKRAFRKELSNTKQGKEKQSKVSKPFPSKSLSENTGAGGGNMAVTNIFVAIVVLIGAVVVYYARKNLLK